MAMKTTARESYRWATLANGTRDEEGLNFRSYARQVFVLTVFVAKNYERREIIARMRQSVFQEAVDFLHSSRRTSLPRSVAVLDHTQSMMEYATTMIFVSDHLKTVSSAVSADQGMMGSV
mmetsp:Transcript_2411/g.3521  ORF Transcript_2411/g.3521 Transcript_2411/m.3521 type:complete len:120 (-) Transcript_2411:300-659(-)